MICSRKTFHSGIIYNNSTSSSSYTIRHGLGIFRTSKGAVSQHCNPFIIINSDRSTLCTTISQTHKSHFSKVKKVSTTTSPRPCCSTMTVAAPHPHPDAFQVQTQQPVHQAVSVACRPTPSKTFRPALTSLAKLTHPSKLLKLIKSSP